MLAFVVPLQSPAVSRDWDLVSRLCVRTLGSVLQQRDASFLALLVCNEPPRNLQRHPALKVIHFDGPPPATQAGRMMDKWLKVRRGLLELVGIDPLYVMVVDADDCVHRDLARWTTPSLAPHGWILETGYVRNHGSRWLLKRRAFDAICGTSSIVRCQPHDLPRDMSDDSSIVLRSGHTGIRRACAARGTPLRPLPFVGAVYNTATGENDSGVDVRTMLSRRTKLRTLLHRRPLWPCMRSAFNLHEL